MTSVKQAVTAGMAYMNEYHPDLHLDLRTLDMGDPKCCVVGQAHPKETYGGGLACCNLWEHTIEMGFDVRFGRADDYAALTAEWKRQIKAKRRSR